MIAHRFFNSTLKTISQQPVFFFSAKKKQI